MDEESIVTIREELLDDFLSLAEEQSATVRRLVEQLDDDQLDTQLRFERYERERRWQEAARRTVAININDEEQSPEQTPTATGTRGSQPNVTQEEQPNEDNVEITVPFGWDGRMSENRERRPDRRVPGTGTG